MGKLIEFKPHRVVTVSDNVGAYQFTENEPAKSSTSVMRAGVCQLCGHSLDGKKNASRDKEGKPCQCGCHPKDL